MTTLVRGCLRALRVGVARLASPTLVDDDEHGAEPAAWERIDPSTLADDLGAVVDDPATAVQTWIERKPPPAMYLHSVEPHANPVMRCRARDLLEGRFRAHTTIAAREEHLPPLWEAPAGSSRTEEMYRHSLMWLEPLIVVAHVDHDDDVWRVVVDVIESWIASNSRPPGRSSGAWHDHAVSFRVRILCWFLELYRRGPKVDEALVRLVVASITQHAHFLADDTTHGHRSNHALEAAGSLLSVCVFLPELADADVWALLAEARLEAYVEQAFADDGFSKEQSPRYHFFILRRLAALVSYLDEVGQPHPASVGRRLDRAAEVWPWLVRPNGSLPRIGDTNERPIPHWRSSLAEIGGESRAAAASSQPNPRQDRAALLAHDAGIYAVMRGQHPDDSDVVDDTHVVFKTDYFRFPHFHHDGLSFVLYALGREWLIDPGPHSYEYDRWERIYLCSSSAHNVVEIGSPFAIHPVEHVAAERTATGDRVTVRHLLDHGHHTRTLEHRPPRRLHLRDDVEVTDGGRHHIRQLFHVHPDCDVEIEGPHTLRLRAPGGHQCAITQRGAGSWRIVSGQREPEPLGWWSPSALTIAPIATCLYELESAGEAHFETHIEVLERSATGATR
jgi:hypothetical protein